MQAGNVSPCGPWRSTSQAQSKVNSVSEVQRENIQHGKFDREADFRTVRFLTASRRSWDSILYQWITVK